MWSVPVLLPVCFLICLTQSKALGDSSRIFAINDNGVQGTGTYKIISGVVKIGLQLTIGEASGKPHDSGTAVITSLPAKIAPNTSPLPNNRLSTSLPPNGKPPPNSEPNTSLPPNSGPGPSLPPKTGPGVSFPPNGGPSTLPPSRQPSLAPPSNNGPSVQPLPNTTPHPASISLTAEDNQFIDDMVAVHNELRSVHFSPPIQNNTQMSLSAKSYALLLASEGELVHSPPYTRPNEGESLAMGCSTADGQATDAEGTANKWYKEVCHHNFSVHAFQEASGHFSQLVWKATEEIGVGRAFGRKWGMNCTYIVARYKPNGNFDSEAAFKDNVEKGTFDPVAYNCSVVDPGSIADEENQFTGATPADKQQHNRLPEKTPHGAENIPDNKVPYRNSNMQRYRQLHYDTSKGLTGNVVGFRSPNSYAYVRKYNSRPEAPRYLGYQINNKGYYSSRFFSNGLNEYETRPRSLISKAKIYHTPLIMKRDKKVVWLLT